MEPLQHVVAELGLVVDVAGDELHGSATVHPEMFVPGTTLASLAMRYLRPVRVGPVVASADVRAELARVDVRDTGSDDRVAVAATTRAFHG